jgi:hypothetical protein
MSRCPVLHELEIREDYDPEHEQTPHLSGGDYDISAIRDCAENCKAASLAWSRGERLRSIALILGLAPGDTAEIDNTVRELIRSRDEWKTRACQEELRADALEIERDRYRAALEWYGEQTRLCRLIHPEGDAGRQALAADGGARARAALAVQP